jgi:hypothetical protein
MSRMSRDKGARGEREVAEIIELASNGTFKAQRGCQHAGRFAVGVNSPDVLTDLPLHLEVKRTEKPAVKAAWAQASADAGIAKEPCVTMRWNGGEWLGLCRFTHIVALHAEIFRLRELLKEAKTATD